MAIKKTIWLEQSKKCAYCGKLISESDVCDLAHIIPQRKWCLAKWGEEIIHHRLNMKVTCHNDNCNSGVQMSPNKTALVEKHVQMIREDLENE